MSAANATHIDTAGDDNDPRWTLRAGDDENTQTAYLDRCELLREFEERVNDEGQLDRSDAYVRGELAQLLARMRVSTPPASNGKAPTPKLASRNEPAISEEELAELEAMTPLSANSSTSELPAYLNIEQIPPISELPNVEGLGAWTPIRITVAGRVKPAPPVILGLLYAARRHVILGPYGVAKTMFLAWAAAVVMKRGGHVLWISVDGTHIGDLLERFKSFGVTEEQLDNQLVCHEHVDELGAQRAKYLHAVVETHDIELAVVDSSMGSMVAEGLDPNVAREVEKWWAEVGDVFKGRRTAVALVDHSGNAEDAKKRASGSHRKQDAPDVVLRLVEKTSLYRGSLGSDVIGETRIMMEKDRPGFHRVRKGTQLATVSFTSHCIRDTEQDDDGEVTVEGEWTLEGSMTWGSDSPGGTSAKTGKKRPTFLMERVSTYLAPLREAISKRAICKNVEGTDRWLIAAIDTLEEEGFVSVDRSTQTHKVTHVRTYTQAADPLVVSDPTELYPEASDDDE